MSNDSSTYQSNAYANPGQQPQYTQYQGPAQTTYQQPVYQQTTTYQEQPHQQSPYTQSQHTQSETQQPVYQSIPYQTSQYQQVTYQGSQSTGAPQHTQYQEQPLAQYHLAQPAQLTQQSLQDLPRPARDNMDVYLRDNQNFERVPQGLETTRNMGVGDWQRRWDASGRR